MPIENEDNEATLRHRQRMGETPGPEHARQEAREGPNTPRRPAASGREKTTSDGAREPAPGEANRLSEPEGRPLDRRRSSL